MVNRLVIAAFLCIFVSFMVVTSNASLIPMSWGFPVMKQDQTLSTMNMQFTNATDLSAATVAFPNEHDQWYTRGFVPNDPARR